MIKKHNVTDIKVSIKHPDRRNIYIDREYAFTISEGIFFKKPIKIGDSLSLEEIEYYKRTGNQHKIKEAAYRLLGFRQRSVREITNRLQQKGWSKKEIEPVINELCESGYLNDLEFAGAFSRDKVRMKHIGPIALRHELFNAGVNNEIIEKVINETYEQFPIHTLIQSILAKKRIGENSTINQKEKKKLVDLLKRKGFSWLEIEPYISKLKIS